jgi:inhibitor of growth protein 3
LNTPIEKRQALSSGLVTPTVRPTTPNLNQVLQAAPTQSVVGYSGNTTLIAQAAAQAIEKTQQMQQGRRTASLKASYEAIQSGGTVTPQELLIGRDFSSTATHTLQVIEREVNSSVTSGSTGQKRQKKKNTNHTLNSASLNAQIVSQASTSTSAALLAQLQQHSNDSDEIPAVVINENGMVVEQTVDGEWTYDPNEPRYCICNQVSYGDMVACDNEEVSCSNWENFIKLIFGIFSVHSSGFTILVWASRPRRKGNGIVRSARLQCDAVVKISHQFNKLLCKIETIV